MTNTIITTHLDEGNKPSLNEENKPEYITDLNFE